MTWTLVGLSPDGDDVRLQYLVEFPFGCFW